MGKRKKERAVHTQEQCDVWLSTTEKKIQAPQSKRQRVLCLRPINVSNITFSSEPIKPGTKQTSIQQFFRNSGKGKENDAIVIQARKTGSETDDVNEPKSSRKHPDRLTDMGPPRTDTRIADDNGNSSYQIKHHTSVPHNSSAENGNRAVSMNRRRDDDIITLRSKSNSVHGNKRLPKTDLSNLSSVTAHQQNGVNGSDCQGSNGLDNEDNSVSRLQKNLPSTEWSQNSDVSMLSLDSQDCFQTSHKSFPPNNLMESGILQHMPEWDQNTESFDDRIRQDEFESLSQSQPTSLDINHHETEQIKPVKVAANVYHRASSSNKTNREVDADKSTETQIHYASGEQVDVVEPSGYSSSLPPAVSDDGSQLSDVVPSCRQRQHQLCLEEEAGKMNEDSNLSLLLDFDVNTDGVIQLREVKHPSQPYITKNKESHDLKSPTCQITSNSNDQSMNRRTDFTGNSSSYAVCLSPEAGSEDETSSALCNTKSQTRKQNHPRVSIVDIDSNIGVHFVADSEVSFNSQDVHGSRENTQKAVSFQTSDTCYGSSEVYNDSITAYSLDMSEDLDLTMCSQGCLKVKKVGRIGKKQALHNNGEILSSATDMPGNVSSNTGLTGQEKLKPWQNIILHANSKQCLENTAKDHVTARSCMTEKGHPIQIPVKKSETGRRQIDELLSSEMEAVTDDEINVRPCKILPHIHTGGTQDLETQGVLVVQADSNMLSKVDTYNKSQLSYSDLEDSDIDCRGVKFVGSEFEEEDEEFSQTQEW